MQFLETLEVRKEVESRYTLMALTKETILLDPQQGAVDDRCTSQHTGMMQTQRPEHNVPEHNVPENNTACLLHRPGKNTSGPKACFESMKPCKLGMKKNCGKTGAPFGTQRRLPLLNRCCRQQPAGPWRH